ncbi:hypothetical protein [Paracoccus niistensis]|uniref:Uncharacterized protein n=1 Tax=Paracoccus niistensis TaxID=632935 RepID=A0ABV6IB27_9RHOB
MKVKINRQSSKRIDFTFEPNIGDAIPPMSSVFLTGHNLHRLRDGMLSLLCFLMARDLISDSLILEGAEVPAYQAAIFQNHFGSLPFMCHPISHVDRAILPSMSPRTQQITEIADTDCRADIAVSDTNLGFEIKFCEGEERERISFISSIPLFCSMASREPRIVLHAIKTIIAFELVGATTLLDPDGYLNSSPIRQIIVDSGIAVAR